ncbi:MAG: hypothetical protein Q9166_003710, partial [cf. Caloplaca sp. 2 TL-2023]
MTMENEESHSINARSNDDTDIEEMEMMDANGVQCSSDGEGDSHATNGSAEELDKSEEEEEDEEP